MLRSILGVVFGIAIGAIAIAFVQRVGHMAYPTPEGVDMKDPAQFKTLMTLLPLGAKLAVVASWFVGAAAGAVAALAIARRWAPTGWVVAATLAAMAGMTMIDIPHPVWMAALAPIAFGAGALAGVKVFGGHYRSPIVRDEGPFPGKA